MASFGPTAPSITTRALGVLGVVGGLGLLLAYAVAIPSSLNTLRLALFCGGAIAIALATYGRHAAISRRLARAGTIPLVAANVWYIAWILLSLGEQRPFAGDFGLVGFWAALAFWLADAWFGVVALRLGVVWRWAALVLVAGSLTAITGIDRLGFTSEADPTVFGPIALTGVALSGLAWILLGVQVAFLGTGRLGTGRLRPSSPAPVDGSG